MLALKAPFVAVRTKHGESYGGNQGWSKDGVMARCGCGVVGAADTLLYLCRNRDYHIEALPALGETLTPERYDALLGTLRKEYLPLIYPLGMNGLTLSMGVNALLRRSNIPLRAKWGAPRGRLYAVIAEMLARDIPVILSIGANFPFFRGKKKLTLYRESPSGAKLKARRVTAHFVTVTGMDALWLRVSSWGQMYYISRAEYDFYIRKHSCRFFSSILQIQEAETK